MIIENPTWKDAKISMPNDSGVKCLVTVLDRSGKEYILNGLFSIHTEDDYWTSRIDFDYIEFRDVIRYMEVEKW